MKFKNTVAQYETMEFEFEKNEDISYIDIISPRGETHRIFPFISTDVEFKYDDEGFESIVSDNKKYKRCKYAPSTIGIYEIKAISDTYIVKGGIFTVVK